MLADLYLLFFVDKVIQQLLTGLRRVYPAVRISRGGHLVDFINYRSNTL